MNHRRSFLKGSVALASAISLPALAKTAQAAPGERTLRLYNTHTGETVRSVFWAEGQFIPDALQDINKVLRDHRNNQLVHVISGYRSPESNAKLRANSTGVAKHSMHMDGKAIDIRLPGKDLAQLRKAAMAMHGGGVGFYPDSQFVHMDTGRVRYW